MSDRLSAEHLHASIVDAHAHDGLAVVDALGTWLVAVDNTIEPPLVTLTRQDTGVSFLLDGSIITISPEGDNVYRVFDSGKNEQRALTELSRLFAQNFTVRST